MAERVGIVAVAQTKYQPNRDEVNAGELVWETIEPVMNEAGVRFTNDDGDGDIESIVTCSQDFWDGMTISSMGVMSFTGGHHATEDKIAEDSLNALFAAYAQILSGHFDMVLVSAHCKESMSDRSIIESASFDPVMMRPLGLDFFISAALQARRYMEKYGVTVLFTAPTAMRVLRKFPEHWFTDHDLSSLRYFFMAGEPLDEPTWNWAAETLGTEVIDHYWQTETGWMILGKNKFKQERKHAWQEIDHSFTKMKDFSKNWTNPKNVEHLNEIEASLAKFKVAQQEIEDISAWLDQTLTN